jgi:hypothetical protein
MIFLFLGCFANGTNGTNWIEVWSPCGVEALIQTAGVPHVEMQEELRIHVPLSVDFRLQKENFGVENQGT